MPPCDINGRESISALHRAKTEICKQIIANISCLMKTNPPYPKRLSHQCSTNGINIILLIVIVIFNIIFLTTYFLFHLSLDIKSNKTLGCFRDGKEIKLLPGYKATLIHTNSQENCLDLCLQSGYVYAGVEYGYEINY